MTYEELSRRIDDDSATDADVARYLAMASMTAAEEVERAIVSRIRRDFDDGQVTGRERIKRALNQQQASS
jgi:hypothetical protein